jgi:hypothetical protein
MVMSRVASITPKAFLDGVTQQLGDESSAIVARAYDITPDMDQNLFMTRCMQWMGDVVFEGNLTRRSLIRVRANYCSAEPRPSKVPYHAHQQEGLPLHVRRPQPLPELLILQPTSSLGRRVLRLQDTAVSLPDAAPQGYIDAPCSTVEWLRSRNRAMDRIQIQWRQARSHHGGGR